MFDKIIENVYQRLIMESDVPIVPDSYAAYISNIDDWTYGLIYDHQRLRDKIIITKTKLILPTYRTCISDGTAIACIQFKSPFENCLDSVEVKLVGSLSRGSGGAAKLAYAIAYGLSPNNNVIPDRSQVLAPARKSWRQVKNSGKRKFVPLSSDRRSPAHCELYGPDDPDSDVLDNAYYAQGWESSVVDKLSAGHRDFLTSLEPHLSVNPDHGKRLDNFFMYLVDEVFDVSIKQLLRKSSHDNSPTSRNNQTSHHRTNPTIEPWFYNRQSCKGNDHRRCLRHIKHTPNNQDRSKHH